jgi:hypothetical protein
MADLLGSIYRAWTDHLAAASRDDLARPSLATAWTVEELALHQLLDARRALVALATPTDAEPDVDRVSYWRSFHPEAGDGGAAHARFVVACAAAYEPARLVGEWAATSAAAARAMGSATHRVVETQGRAITREDLRSTLVVEATIHLLDAHGTPPEAALAETIEVLEGLGGRALPRHDAAEVLRATGRLPSDVAAYPLLG